MAVAFSQLFWLYFLISQDRAVSFGFFLLFQSMSGKNEWNRATYLFLIAGLNSGFIKKSHGEL
ncbi:hypothetical protein A7Q10_01990 [Methylacidiphilum caldifontis]|uniref:Uncharacterized protein n=1 Tax=Methylacidiphilum caldifontis TaxID=2795386 RepID=A0A4Y8P832_9BACT|nr:hypothetical protein A7Q10_01990 [Methylacidiphilum caldifontis]